MLWAEANFSIILYFDSVVSRRWPVLFLISYSPQIYQIISSLASLAHLSLRVCLLRVNMTQDSFRISLSTCRSELHLFSNHLQDPLASSVHLLPDELPGVYTI